MVRWRSRASSGVLLAVGVWVAQEVGAVMFVEGRYGPVEVSSRPERVPADYDDFAVLPRVCAMLDQPDNCTDGERLMAWVLEGERKNPMRFASELVTRQRAAELIVPQQSLEDAVERAAMEAGHAVQQEMAVQVLRRLHAAHGGVRFRSVGTFGESAFGPLVEGVMGCGRRAGEGALAERLVVGSSSAVSALATSTACGVRADVAPVTSDFASSLRTGPPGIAGGDEAAQLDVVVLLADEMLRSVRTGMSLEAASGALRPDGPGCVIALVQNESALFPLVHPLLPYWGVFSGGSDPVVAPPEWLGARLARDVGASEAALYSAADLFGSDADAALRLVGADEASGSADEKKREESSGAADAKRAIVKSFLALVACRGDYVVAPPLRESRTVVPPLSRASRTLFDEARWVELRAPLPLADTPRMEAEAALWRGLGDAGHWSLAEEGLGGGGEGGAPNVHLQWHDSPVSPAVPRWLERLARAEAGAQMRFSAEEACGQAGERVGGTWQARTCAELWSDVRASRGADAKGATVDALRGRAIVLSGDSNDRSLVTLLCERVRKLGGWRAAATASGPRGAQDVLGVRTWLDTRRWSKLHSAHVATCHLPMLHFALVSVFHLGYWSHPLHATPINVMGGHLDDSLPQSLQRAGALARVPAALHALFAPPPFPAPPARRCTCAGTHSPCPQPWRASAAAICHLDPFLRAHAPARAPLAPRHLSPPPPPTPALFSPSAGLWTMLGAWERVLQAVIDDSSRRPVSATSLFPYAVAATARRLQQPAMGLAVADAVAAAARVLPPSTPVLLRTPPFSEPYTARLRHLPSQGRVEAAFGWDWLHKATKDPSFALSFGAFEPVVLRAAREQVFAAAARLAPLLPAPVAVLDQFSITGDALAAVWPGDVAQQIPRWAALKQAIELHNVSHLVRSGDGFHSAPLVAEAVADMILDAIPRAFFPASSHRPAALPTPSLSDADWANHALGALWD